MVPEWEREIREIPGCGFTQLPRRVTDGLSSVLQNLVKVLHRKNDFHILSIFEITKISHIISCHHSSQDFVHSSPQNDLSLKLVVTLTNSEADLQA